MAKLSGYKVLQGIDYSNGKRAEVGEVVSDLPKDAISWLLATGAISEDLNAVTEAPVESVVEEVVVEPNDPVVEEVPEPTTEVIEELDPEEEVA